MNNYICCAQLVLQICRRRSPLITPNIDTSVSCTNGKASPWHVYLFCTYYTTAVFKLIYFQIAQVLAGQSNGTYQHNWQIYLWANKLVGSLRSVLVLCMYRFSRVYVFSMDILTIIAIISAAGYLFYRRKFCRCARRFNS